MNYKEYNDYELISYIRDNIEEANDIIFDKYKPLIETNTRRLIKYCKNNGLEFNDLYQEGMLGLDQAVNTFNEAKDASFYTYAKMCIERKQVSALISSERLKHKLLNESISYDINDNDEPTNIPKVLIDNSNNPESVIIDTEASKELYNKICNLLTPFEKEVFELKINGHSYTDIAEILKKDKKQIDNTIQRIKRKIKDNLDY